MIDAQPLTSEELEGWRKFTEIEFAVKPVQLDSIRRFLATINALTTQLAEKDRIIELQEQMISMWEQSAQQEQAP